MYGIISGWKGGGVDNVMQRIIEIISSVPNLIIVVLMLVVLKPGITSIILAIAISSWTTMARQIRAETLSLKNEEYVLAARSLGEIRLGKLLGSILFLTFQVSLLFKRCTLSQVQFSSKHS